jgi:hypothetical protein
MALHPCMHALLVRFHAFFGHRTGEEEIKFSLELEVVYDVLYHIRSLVHEGVLHLSVPEQKKENNNN